MRDKRIAVLGSLRLPPKLAKLPTIKEDEWIKALQDETYSYRRNKIHFTQAEMEVLRKGRECDPPIPFVVLAKHWQKRWGFPDRKAHSLVQAWSNGRSR